MVIQKEVSDLFFCFSNVNKSLEGPTVHFCLTLDIYIKRKMANFILTQNQFELLVREANQNIKFHLAEQNWNSFTREQKQGIVETLLLIYPEKRMMIKEDKWYNTLGDIIGIFDPTGVVDLINGISYISQGDYLFGLLSIISVVPYAGDVVAKPMMGYLKIASPATKGLEKTLKMVKAGDSAGAAKLLDSLVSQGGITKTFVDGFAKIAGKLRNIVERAPNNIFGGLKRTILQWFDLFQNAAVRSKSLRTAGQDIVKGMTGVKGLTASIRPWSKKDQIKKLEELISLSKKTPGIFTGYRTSKGILSWKSLFGGMPQLIGRNKSVRALMRQTKWWLGFLDWMGLGNYVGPEEILNTMSESELEKKITEYNKTRQAEENFNFDFGEAKKNMESETTTKPPTETQSSETTSTDNPIASLFRKIFLGTLNPLP